MSKEHENMSECYAGDREKRMREKRREGETEKVNR